MSLKNLSQEIEKGLPLPIYFLYANDPYLLEEAVSRIKPLVPETDADFNLSIFDLDSAENTATPEEIIGTLNTISFFGSRRFVIAKNFQKLPSKELKKFQPYMENPSPHAVLMIFHTGTIKKELREIIKGIKNFSLDIREHELPYWVKEQAKKKGLAIKDDAIEYLIGIAGAEMGVLSSEIEKLAMLKNETITVDSIKEIVEGNKNYGVFDLTRALKEKNSGQVFSIYKVLKETFEPYSLLGAINWQYSQMSIKATNDSQKNYFNRVFELLNHADIQIKTSGGAYPLEHLLSRLLKL